MELKLKLKKKKESKSETKSKLTSFQKLSLHALQKQKQLIELKEWLFVLGFIGTASFLRVLMQGLPNVEPLTFFAVLAGWLFGKKKGIIVGASSLYISNFFVIGGQGPWTILQVLAFGIAGFLGGFLRKKSTMLEAVAVMVITTLISQIIFNVGWSVLIGFNVLLAFATGLLFTIIHLVSNTIFALLLPSARKFVDNWGGFSEKELCDYYISRINAGFDNRRVKAAKEH
ncbi:hypothetical protein HYX02_05360 [Candidatus Woesearchaeota archaeon]|nr:hypothetical protein [Candidatus Woesearchaeota archaeon]